MRRLISNKKIIISLLCVFFTVELCLGIAIQHTDGGIYAALCYAAIVLAFLFSLLSFEHSFDFLFTSIAMLGTVMADLFLVVCNPMRQLPAMLFFSLTQLAYFTRILLKSKNKPIFITHIALRGVLSTLAVVLTAASLGENADPVATVSLFYFANLITNVIFSFIQFKTDPVLAIGLLLFMLCDFFIGMNLIEGYLPVGDNRILSFLIDPGFNAAWLFYVPSQALLAASVFSQRLRK